MKALLCLCSILFFICTVSFPFTVAQESNAVFDFDGDELKVGTKYYLVSAIPGPAAGGLALNKYSNEVCDITVSQEIQVGQDTVYGLPCTFHPANSTESIIYLSKSLNVMFETSVPCAGSTVWRLGKLDPNTGLRLIQIGGKLGNPSCATYRNWFRIENAPSLGTYKFVYDTEDVCSTPQERYNLTIAYAIEQRPMILSKDSHFTATFIKAASAIRIRSYV